MVTILPAPSTAGGREEIIVSATPSGDCSSTLIVVVGWVERSEAERTPVLIDRFIPDDSISPSSSSRFLIDFPSEEENDWNLALLDRAEITATDAEAPPERILDERDI
jgi:hypothetical protein